MVYESTEEYVVEDDDDDDDLEEDDEDNIQQSENEWGEEVAVARRRRFTDSRNAFVLEVLLLAKWHLSLCVCLCALLCVCWPNGWYLLISCVSCVRGDGNLRMYDVFKHLG